MNNNFMIIGGNSAIGKTITRHLADNGATVFVGSRNPDALPELKGVQPFTFNPKDDDPSEISMPETLQGLLYCPGTIRLRPFNRLKLEEFEEDLQVNLLGAVKILQASIDALKKSENPSSVVLFSTVAVQTGMPFHASIASAKGAVEGLVRSLAAEYAPKVRFNGIAPSLVDTPLAGQLLSNDAKRDASAQRHPLKRIGMTEDIARAALYLLSEQSSWISGQIWQVDGGMSGVRTF